MMISLLSALAVAAAQPPEPPSPLVPPPPERTVTLAIDRDPITDAITAFAVAHAPNGDLLVGCDPDRYEGLRVFLRGEGWIVSSWFSTNLFTGARAITYRFDADQPQRAMWHTREGVAELRSTSDVTPFVERMMRAQRVAVRTRDAEGREVDHVFPLAGANQAVGEMLRTCGAQMLLRAR